MFKLFFSACLFVIYGSFSVNALAEVVISGTRIIFNAADKESTVQLKNNGKQPYLLQMWIDDGDADARPGDIHVPFVITPPVVRIDPDKGQTVRIKMTRPSLPQDRESLYWFNMLEIPPKPVEMGYAVHKFLQIAFRTRIKLFYRPENLKLQLQDAYKNLTFSLVGNSLHITNSSPYFITMSKIEVRKRDAVLAFVSDFPDRMITPKGSLILPLAMNKAASLSKGTVVYSVINDYGGESTNEQVLQKNK